MDAQQLPEAGLRGIGFGKSLLKRNTQTYRDLVGQAVVQITTEKMLDIAEKELGRFLLTQSVAKLDIEWQSKPFVEYERLAIARFQFPRVPFRPVATNLKAASRAALR